MVGATAPGATAPGVAPTNCPRRQALVYPGQPFCANCGLDYRFAGMTPVRKSRSKLIAFGAIVAVLLVAVAGFVVLNQSSGWTPAAEASPSGTWYAFTAPDSSWNVMFPSSATPQVVSQTMPSGNAQAQVSFYVVRSDAGVAYEAGQEDIPSGQLSSNAKTNLDGAEQGIKMFASVTNSRDLTFQGQQAREIKFKFTNADLEGYARFWASGSRVYILMVAGAPGSTMYPEHFFETFKVN